jgi:protein-L-isoaspartate(D-aspartate) O-methyltransferase
MPPAHDFEDARHAMVADQLEARGITNERVLDAMRTIPREEFVGREHREHAYDDNPLRIEEGQTISQPYMVALMTQLLNPRPEDRVLEVGTGSGYQTAILASLAREVYTIERHAPLAESARERLHAMGYGNVTVTVGDGTLGHPPGAPYNAIIVTAGAPRLPEALKSQLAEDGRLVCPAGSEERQQLTLLERAPEGWHESTHTRCVFVPLIGAGGWKPRR